MAATACRGRDGRASAGSAGRRRGPLATATLALVLAGCASGPATRTPPRDEPVTLAQSMVTGPSEAVGRLTGADNGLELRKWLVDDEPDRIAVAMSRTAVEPALGPDADRRFRRNGLRFVRTPLDRLPELLDALGGASVNVHGWHGQVTRWRALHELSLGRDAQTLAIDGRFRRFEGGRFRLLARAWTVPMEDGPHVQLELVPEYLRSSRQGADLRQLIDPELGARLREPFTSMAVDVALEPGYAYLLTYEAPRTDWTEGGAQAETAEPTGGGLGPDAVAPPTIGQRMLHSERGRPARGVLVFVPRIPVELFPPEVATLEQTTTASTTVWRGRG